MTDMAIWASFRARGVRPGINPGLDPIGNLRETLQLHDWELVMKLLPVSSVERLTRQLQEVWAEILPDVLHNLVSSLPGCLRQRVANSLI